MNKVLKYLIASDILIWSGISFMSPIIAIFINDRLIGGSIFAAGLATTLVYLVRAAILVPLGVWNDRERGNKREYFTLLTGIAIMSLIPLTYIFIRRIEYFFLVQCIYGVGLALYYPGWFTIWTRFVDGFSEGRSWAIYGSLTSLFIALAALAGGYLAQFIGFDTVFVMVSIVGFLSIILITLVKKNIYAWPKSKSSRNRSGV